MLICQCSLIIFSPLSCLHNKRDPVPLMAFVKKHARSLATESPEELYAQLVTQYTLCFIKNQLSLQAKVELLDDFMETLSYHHKVVSLYLLCDVNVCSGKV